VADKRSDDSEKLYGVIGVCTISPTLNQIDRGNSSFHGGISLFPESSAAQLFSEARFDINLQADIEAASIEVYQQPKYGKIVIKDGFDYKYIPNENYKGNDSIVFIVNISGIKVKVVYFIKVINATFDTINDYKRIFKKACSKSDWKISSTIIEPQSATTSFNNIQLNFAPLNGSAVGETTGTTITLSSNAAGHGWFTNPQEDWLTALTQQQDTNIWLPTSNPNEWKARIGSGAEDKMDLLSVLWHEMGHALGLDHSQDQHDLMAPTLSTGLRRLPSVEEMALLTGALNLSVANQNTPQPYAPTAPYPINVNLSFLLAALRRREGQSNNQENTNTYYSLAANSKLESLDNHSAWITTGDTNQQPNAITLTETQTGDNQHSQLNQIFTLNENDRYLQFTVKRQLTDVANAPDDAFEMALLNAATGLSVLGATGLIRSDAALNIQADGTQRQAQGLNTIHHSDGSQTYTIDLQGIAAGTTLNLVFDLIGFGEANSQVTISDVALVGAPQTLDDSVTIDEDSTININVLSNDINASIAGFTPVVVAAPQHGHLVVNADGTFSYTPDSNYSGTDSFSYTLSDGINQANIAQVSINVNPFNDVPLSANQSIAIDEDNTVTISLVATDIDSINLNTVILSQPQHGTLSLNTDGCYSYTPVANFNGTDSFSYVVNDGELDSSIATVSITVNAVNDVPVVANAQLSVLEDGRLVFDLLAQGSDVDGDVLSLVSVTQPLHGSIEQDTNGTYYYVPNANYNGTDSFSFTVSDGVGTVTGTATVQVSAVNDAPVINDFVATLQEDGQLIIDLTNVISDVDGDALSLNISPAQYGSLSQSAQGIYVYTPYAHVNGIEQLTVTASDGTVSNQGVIRLTITAVNDAPIAVNDSVTTLQGESVRIDVLANDSDVDSVHLWLRLLTEPQSGQLALQTDGSLLYIPNTGFYGTDSFSYVTYDGQSDSAPATVTIHVIAKNQAPVAVDDNITLFEDTPIRFNPLANDSDADGDNLIFRVLSQPSKGQIVVNSDKTISYTPNANYSGDDSFSYQLNDGQADSAIATVRLHIAAVADAPILTLNSNNTSNPTRELFRTSWESVSDRNYTSTLVEQTQLEGWTLLTKPDNSRGGSNGFEVWSTDDRMADNLNRQRTVTSMAGNGNNWLELNNARNNMAQSLGIQRQVDTIAGATYTLSMDVAGRLGYSSDYTKIGIYVDGVRIGGDDSTSGNTALNWQTKQFSFVGNGRKQTIQILGEATKQDGNGRGMMIDDIVLTERLANNTGLEDTSIKLSAISARLKDDDGSETLALTIEAIPVGATLSDGTRSFTATTANRTANITTWNLSNLSLTPPKDVNGTINLQVKATATERSNGSTASTTETLSVKVLPVNDAPIAKNATFTVQRNGSVRIDFSQLVSDVDGDILSLIPDCPSKGTLSKNSDGSYTYTPRRNYTGKDSFTYTVNDGTSCVQATISLVVQNQSNNNNNDDDDCHRHHHDNHGGHYGHSQSITIQSVYANNTANNTPSYVVINNNANTSPSTRVVNWDIFSPQVGISLQPQVLTQHNTDANNLATLTGLIVKKC